MIQFGVKQKLGEMSTMVGCAEHRPEARALDVLLSVLFVLFLCGASGGTLPPSSVCKRSTKLGCALACGLRLRGAGRPKGWNRNIAPGDQVSSIAEQSWSGGLHQSRASGALQDEAQEMSEFRTKTCLGNSQISAPFANSTLCTDSRTFDRPEVPVGKPHILALIFTLWDHCACSHRLLLCCCGEGALGRSRLHASSAVFNTNFGEQIQQMTALSALADSLLGLTDWDKALGGSAGENDGMLAENLRQLLCAVDDPKVQNVSNLLSALGQVRGHTLLSAIKRVSDVVAKLQAVDGESPCANEETRGKTLARAEALDQARVEAQSCEPQSGRVEAQSRAETGTRSAARRGPLVPSAEQVDLWHAIDNGNEVEVKRLLGCADVEPDMADPQHWAGIRALHRAARYDNAGVVCALIQGGATLSLTDRYAETVLHAAAREHNVRTVALLTAQERGVARKNNAVSKRKCLHMDPSQIDARNVWGQSALMVALDWDGSAPGSSLERRSISQTRVVELLLGVGADVGSEDEAGWTPLHFAARWGRIEAAELLLKARDVKVNAMTCNGHTALDWAVEVPGNCTRLVEIIENAGGVRTLSASESVWDRCCWLEDRGQDEKRGEERDEDEQGGEDEKEVGTRGIKRRKAASYDLLKRALGDLCGRVEHEHVRKMAAREHGNGTDNVMLTSVNLTAVSEVAEGGVGTNLKGVVADTKDFRRLSDKVELMAAWLRGQQNGKQKEGKEWNSGRVHGEMEAWGMRDWEERERKGEGSTGKRQECVEVYTGDIGAKEKGCEDDRRRKRPGDARLREEEAGMARFVGERFDQDLAYHLAQVSSSSESEATGSL